MILLCVYRVSVSMHLSSEIVTLFFVLFPYGMQYAVLLIHLVKSCGATFRETVTFDLVVLTDNSTDYKDNLNMEKKYIHGDDVVDSTSTDDSGTPTSSLNNNPELPITRVYNRDPESSNWWTESDTGIGALAGLATGAAALLVGSTAMAARLIFGSRTRRLVYRHIGIKGRYDPSIPRTAFIFSYDYIYLVVSKSCQIYAN